MRGRWASRALVVAGCLALAVGVLVIPASTTRAAAAVSPPGTKVVFAGDYETGDLSQWNNCQTKNFNAPCGNRTVVGPAPNIKIVGKPTAHQGNYAAQFTVRRGDIPPFGGGVRAEVASDVTGAVTTAGDERWYSWSMFFPNGFVTPVNDSWFIVMQWHGNDTNSPPLAINIGPRGTVDIGGDGVPHPTKTLGPIRRGQWVDYTLHVLFSTDPKVGFVEGTENGALTVPKTFRATLNGTGTGTGTYLKQGIYRDPTDKVTSTLIHDGLTISAPANATITSQLPPRPQVARPNPPGTPQDEN